MYTLTKKEFNDLKRESQVIFVSGNENESCEAAGVLTALDKMHKFK